MDYSKFLKRDEPVWYCPECGNEQLDHNGGSCIECDHVVVRLAAEKEGQHAE